MASDRRTNEASAAEENLLIMEKERVLNVFETNTDFPMKKEKWDIRRYISSINVKVVNESEDGMTLEFDLIGVEAAIANALRRVLIAEVPTMAIEKVYVYQNTSIIPDEMLCHRFGLLPIKADPRLFKMPQTPAVSVNETGVDCVEEPAGDPDRNLIFEIKIRCSEEPNAPTSFDSKVSCENTRVYSNSFKWIPIGNQSGSLPYAPCMVHNDILVAQLQPRQEIEARCHCVKGIGRDHAKFSPVATASYRLLPRIVLKKKITGADALTVKQSFSKGVIGIDSEGAAFVKDARSDTCSRNILQHEHLVDSIELSRVKDHFIFSVESTGALRSSELVIEACKILEEKCRRLKAAFLKRLGEVHFQEI